MTIKGMYLNVKDEGAKGDNAANDTTAIQKAIDKLASAGGGTLSFPAGTYRHTGLIMRPNVRLVGESMSRTILMNTHATQSSIRCFGEALGNVTYVSNFKIEDMSIRTLNDKVVGQHGIDLSLSHTFELKSLDIQGHDNGVQDTLSWYGYFENVKSQFNRTGHFSKLHPTIAATPNTRINCFNLHNTEYGIYIGDSVTQLTITGGACEWNGISGVKVLGNTSRNVVFYGLNIEGNVLNAIEVGDDIAAPAGVSFQNCIIRRDTTSAGSIGIRLKKAIDFEVSNCRFFNYDTGVKTDSSASFTFDNNSFDTAVNAYDFDGDLVTITEFNNKGFKKFLGDWNGIMVQSTAGFEKIKPTYDGVKFNDGITLATPFTKYIDFQYYFLSGINIGITSVPANSTLSVYLTCPGVTFNDQIFGTIDWFPEGIIWAFHVNGADSVAMRLANVTGSAITVDAVHTIRVVRQQYS